MIDSSQRVCQVAQKEQSKLKEEREESEETNTLIMKTTNKMSLPNGKSSKTKEKGAASYKRKGNEPTRVDKANAKTK